MLGNYWLLIAALLFIVSLITHQVPLLLISLLFILARGVARLWERYCLARIDYRRRLSARRVFFGDEVQLEVEVANRKPLPLSWIQIDDEVPSEVAFEKVRTTPSHKANRSLLTNLLSLSWYHKVTRRYHMRCLQRGFFAFGPTRIRSGDLFGFFSRGMEVAQVDYLMVYPRILSLEKLGIISNQPVGDIRTKRHIFQDPILTLGVREYQFGDSLKQIHWKSTARLGQLQTKVFEPTTTTDICIFMDVRTMPLPFWGGVPRLLELVIITAASVANHTITSGHRAGLYVNQKKVFPDEIIRIPPSQHTDQMMHILEALAQVHPSESMPIARFVVNESRNLPWGSTMVVISAIPNDDLLASLYNLRRAGRRVVLVIVGDTAPAVRTDGLTVYHVRDDVIWRDLESVTVTGE